MDVVIYHNPGCGTSRNTLALIRNVGVEPHVIEYLKCPPSRAMVAWLAERTGLGVRGLPWPVASALVVGGVLLAVGVRRERRPVAGFAVRLADLR